MASATFEPLLSQTLSSNQPNIVFSNIPQGYTNLYVSFYGSNAVANGSVCYRVGSGTTDSGTNYSATWHYGYGAPGSPTQAGNRVGNQTLGALIGWQVGLVVNNLYFADLEIFNYSSNSTYKTMVGKGIATTDNLLEEHVTTWRSTAAIDTLTVFNNGGQLAAGTTVSLYGLRSI